MRKRETMEDEMIGTTEMTGTNGANGANGTAKAARDASVTGVFDKEAEAALEPVCARICELRTARDRIEKELKEAEARVKDEFKSRAIESRMVGRFAVELTRVAESFIVDSAKLKADGLFDLYSKKKAGYDRLSVKDMGGAL